MSKETGLIKDLHTRVEMIRKSAGLSQSQTAEILGMTRTAYVYAEKYSVTIDPDFVERFARHFKVSIYYLMGAYKEQRNPVFKEPPGEYYATTDDKFITTKKERDAIKMLRMIPGKRRGELYDLIEKTYKETRNRPAANTASVKSDPDFK